MQATTFYNNVNFAGFVYTTTLDPQDWYYSPWAASQQEKGK